MQAYSDPTREDDTYSLPDVEIWYAEIGEAGKDGDGDPMPAGYYYWACFPGCMPDGDAEGPFDSEEEALADMRENWGPEESQWEVIVGNIGTVYRGTDETEARERFKTYSNQSLTGYGRASGESVCLMRDDEPVKELVGTVGD